MAYTAVELQAITEQALAGKFSKLQQVYEALRAAAEAGLYALTITAIADAGVKTYVSAQLIEAGFTVNADVTIISWEPEES